MGFTITVWVGVRKYDKRWAPKDEPHINIGSAWKIVTQYINRTRQSCDDLDLETTRAEQSVAFYCTIEGDTKIA